jgi:hypothetical protein
MYQPFSSSTLELLSVQKTKKMNEDDEDDAIESRIQATSEVQEEFQEERVLDD